MATGRVRLEGPDIGARIALLGSAIQRSRPKTLGRALDRGKREHLRVMQRDAGGDLRLSGVGKVKGRPGNARIGVRYVVHGTGASGELKATGPVHLINNPTAGRVIRSSYVKGRYRRGGRTKDGRRSGFVGPELPGVTFRGNRRAVLRLPDGGFRQSVRHPGTRGKKTWQRGKAKARPVITKTMSTNTTAALVEAMRG